MTMIDKKPWNQLKTNFIQSRPAIENPKSLGGEKFKAIEKYWYGLQGQNTLNVWTLYWAWEWKLQGINFVKINITLRYEGILNSQVTAPLPKVFCSRLYFSFIRALSCAKNFFIKTFCIVCLIGWILLPLLLLKVKELREQFHKRRMKTSQASER